MRNRMRLGAVTVALILVAVVALPALAADESMTVGRFVTQIAENQHLDASDVPTAVGSLRAAGIRIPAGIDYNKRLTEGDVAQISQLAGLKVRTSSPGAYFDEGQVDRFMLSFAGELGTRGDDSIGTDSHTNPGQGSGPGNGNGNGPPFDPFAKGKHGKGKGKGPHTPTDPE